MNILFVALEESGKKISHKILKEFKIHFQSKKIYDLSS